MRCTRVVHTAVAMLALHTAAQAQIDVDAFERDASINEIIVKWSPSICKDEAAKALEMADIEKTLVARFQDLGYVGKMSHRTKVRGHFLLDIGRSVGHGEAYALATALGQGDCVSYADPNLRYFSSALPNDTKRSAQWYHSDPTSGIEMLSWGDFGKLSLTVAILDTGHASHPDMPGSMGDADPGDSNEAGDCGGWPAQGSSWHGTRVGSLINAKVNNALGIAGITGTDWSLAIPTPIVNTRHYKVLGRCGGTLDQLINGMTKAVDDVVYRNYGTFVFNLSLNGDGPCPAALQAQFDRAYAVNTVVVVSAGNLNKDVTGVFPSNCRGVVAVGAVDRQGRKTYYSNFGANVALSAPGGDLRNGMANGILTATNPGYDSPEVWHPGQNDYLFTDAYRYSEGTSFSAPMVTAALAAMRSVNIEMSAVEMVATLKSSTRAFSLPCTGCGTGMLNIAKAVNAVRPPRRRPPPPPDCNANPDLCK